MVSVDDRVKRPKFSRRVGVAAAASKGCNAYEPVFLHIDVKYLPQMPDETKRRNLFVAIDRATRWVFVRIMSAKTPANARRFLKECFLAEEVTAPAPLAAVSSDSFEPQPARAAKSDQ